MVFLEKLYAFQMQILFVAQSTVSAANLKIPKTSKTPKFPKNLSNPNNRNNPQAKKTLYPLPKNLIRNFLPFLENKNWTVTRNNCCRISTKQS
jgi:hypothetical protein